MNEYLVGKTEHPSIYILAAFYLLYNSFVYSRLVKSHFEKVGLEWRQAIDPIFKVSFVNFVIQYLHCKAI